MRLLDFQLTTQGRTNSLPLTASPVVDAVDRGAASFWGFVGPAVYFVRLRLLRRVCGKRKRVRGASLRVEDGVLP